MSVHYKKEELRLSKKMYNRKKGENSYFSRREPRKYFIIGSRMISAIHFFPTTIVAFPCYSSILSDWDFTNS